MATKKIKYFSAVTFKNYMKSLGYVSFDWNRRIPYNDIPRQDFAVISIGNPEWLEDVDNNTDLWANGINNHWLPGCFENVLNIEFGDCGEGEFDSMGETQAYDIVKFIIKNQHKNNFYIHCGAGISRSGAVATFIYDFFKEKGVEVEILPHLPRTPNQYVRKMLWDMYEQNLER